jgi:hypothetical protein
LRKRINEYGITLSGCRLRFNARKNLWTLRWNRHFAAPNFICSRSIGQSGKVRFEKAGIIKEKLIGKSGGMALGQGRLLQAFGVARRSFGAAPGLAKLW